MRTSWFSAEQIVGILNEHEAGVRGLASPPLEGKGMMLRCVSESAGLRYTSPRATARVRRAVVSRCSQSPTKA